MTTRTWFARQLKTILRHLFTVPVLALQLVAAEPLKPKGKLPAPDSPALSAKAAETKTRNTDVGNEKGAEGHESLVKSTGPKAVQAKPIASRPFSYAGSVAYQRQFDPLVYPTMSLGGQFSMSHGPWSYVASLAGLKRFILSKTEQELDIVGANLLSQYNLAANRFSLAQSLGLNFSLPLNLAARLNQSRGRLDIRHSLSRSKWSLSGLNVSFTSSLSLYLSRYKSAHPDLGAGSMPRLLLRGQLGLAYAINSRITVAAAGSYGQIHYHKITGSDYDGSEPRHPYSVSLSSIVKAAEHASIGLNYGQGDMIEQYGRSDFFIFDRLRSSLSLSFSYVDAI